MPTPLEQPEESEDTQLPQAQGHTAADRDTISTDYALTLRRYLNDTASPDTDTVTSTTPSMEVSSIETSDTGGATYYRTAPTHPTGEPGLTTIPEQCNQLFLRNFATSDTMLIHANPSYLVKEDKDIMRQRLKLPNAQFELTHSGRVLSPDKTLDDCNIAHNSTLTCVSFPPSISDGRSTSDVGYGNDPMWANTHCWGPPAQAINPALLYHNLDVPVDDMAGYCPLSILAIAAARGQLVIRPCNFENRGAGD